MSQSYTTRQKIILTVYVILGLPLLPLTAIMYPFSKWVTQDANEAKAGVKIKFDLVEWLSVNLALCLYLYLMVGLMHWLPPDSPHH